MKFKVAEHIFSLSIDSSYNYLLGAYQPFLYDDNQPVLFSVEVVDTLEYSVVETVLEDVELGQEIVRVDLYKTTEGILYNVIMPTSSVVNSQLHIVGSSAKIYLNPQNDRFHNSMGFTNSMILSYITYTQRYNTLLIHASAILKDSVAHIFLGKSGTGKSTHSRMWQEVYPDAELLNDDHPVIRRFDSGEVFAFGSPWSGKTPCYKNLSAPLSSIVRIKRAGYNKLNRLSILRSYASIMTSCSGLQWDSELSQLRVKCLEGIILAVGCYEMECLPNNEAAICCYEGLCEK